MRLYYIFSIRDDIYGITKNNPEKLYILLKNIYNLNKSESKLGYKLFEKSCYFLDKKTINNLLKEINVNNYSYTCFRNTHIINDFYSNETTKLTVNYSHMYLKTNVLYPSFLTQIQNIKNIFICDFINEDYFYLNKLNNKSTTR